MSFGFASRVEGYEELEKAISDASNRGVVLFAAASNNGGNDGRAFPARHDSVICVHSSDANGNRSRFSPTAEPNRLNLSILGENVSSSWPNRLCGGLGGPTNTIRKSGTSYATAIMVGVAAWMLQYTREKLTGDDATMIRNHSRMSAVLRSIAGPIPRDEYYYIAPNFRRENNFFGASSDHIRSSIIRILRTS